MNKISEEECCFCGDPVECRDHIPPRGMFPNPKPTDLITVPCCKQCNEETMLDDEYFRWFVATGSGESPEAERLVKERVLKRFRDRPALLETILRGSVLVDVYSKGGIFLEQRPGFRYDRKRIQRIIEKITRGLFWHEKGSRLGNDYSVIDFKLNPVMPDELLQVVQTTPLKSVANGIFRYGFTQCAEDENSALWVFVFFDQMLILTMTKRKQIDGATQEPSN
jgi:hypothetical protein